MNLRNTNLLLYFVILQYIFDLLLEPLEAEFL